MAYDELLAQQLRDKISPLGAIAEKRMMGGACFMVDGNMIGGADRQDDGRARFMFRVGKDNEDEALSRSGATAVVQGGKKKGGLIFVYGNNFTDEQLSDWVNLAWEFVKTLQPK